MESFAPLLLDVWREVCRHLEISESVARLIPILRRRLPVRRVLIRRLDLSRSCVETVAAEGMDPGTALDSTRSDCTPESLERVLRWSGAQEVYRGPAGQLAEAVPGLLPAGLEGDVLAGSLHAEDGTAGLLVLGSEPTHHFEPGHELMMRELLEPFAVGLQNDRRVRELTALREAVEADNRSLLSRLGRHDISDSVVGSEAGLRTVMAQVDLVARSDVPVLILGETGSGKEVVARAVHTRSRRASAPFLRVNCGAIPSELVDSELFGHERGSFTGAVGARRGWFERADGGTLFLDECGELPLAAQVRLLRILQDGTFQRVGGEKTQRVDVRIVAATHRDLHQMVADGRFREDLWYRVSVFPIRLPPLRERPEDIPALAAHFALQAARRLGTASLVPTPDEVNLLVAYDWPGNVRELAAVIERAAILGDGKSLRVADALGVSRTPSASRPTMLAVFPRPEERDDFLSLDAAMARHIERALDRTQGCIEGPRGAARLLRINPHTLRARMRKLGVEWQKYRRQSA